MRGVLKRTVQKADTRRNAAKIQENKQTYADFFFFISLDSANL